MRLQTKLPLLLIPLIVIPLLVVNYLAYSQLSKRATEEASFAVTNLLNQLVETSDHEMAIAKRNVKLFSHFPILKYYLEADDPGERYGLLQRPAMKELLYIQEVYSNYRDISIVLPNGRIELFLSNSAGKNTPKYWNGPPFPLETSTSPSVRYQLNKENGKLTLYAASSIVAMESSMPSKANTNESLGKLIIAIDTNFLARMINDITIGLKGGLLLSDGQGKILFTSANINFSDMAISEFEDFWSLPESTVSTQDNKLVKKLQPIELSTGEYYVSNQRISDNLFAHVIIPKQKLFSQEINQWISFSSSIIIFVAIPLLFFMLRRHIVTPIRRLNQAVLDMGSEHKSVEIEALHDDELGELSQSFNMMSHKLNQFHSRVHSLAYKDTLTGLANRTMFRKTLNLMMLECKKQHYGLALLYLDLDNFKNINDTLGHKSGDLLLKNVAQILDHNIRQNDFVSHADATEHHTIARLGGDEFIILVSHVHDQQEVDIIASRILKALDRPMILDGQDFHVSTSIGIAVFPDDGVDAVSLIKNADLAMYQAKKQGKNRYQFFSKSIGAHKLASVQLEQKLRRAIENQEFELYYQPQINGSTYKIASVEALIRWPDEEQGIINPDQFIPLAEETGLIVPIGEWTLEAACKQLKEWIDLKLPAIDMAVNVSGVQLNNANLITQVTQALRRSKLDPKYLHLELTESAILNGHEAAIKVLNILRSRGISIALDDFGTGYSSLSYLQTLPIDILKIDRSFIAEIHQRKNAPVLSAIITMAHALSLKVVAEGIEDSYQVDFMRTKQCDLLQGYFFSRPVSATELERMLRKQQQLEDSYDYQKPHSA